MEPRTPDGPSGDPPVRPGLSRAEAARRLAEHGPNALPKPAPTPAWRRVLRQFQNPLIYILLFALAFDLGSWLLTGAGGWPIESLAIAAVLLLNAGLGTYQERRSEQALAELEALAAPHAWALRDGVLVQVPSHTLVPGDVVRVEAGERVPADGRLVEALGVLVDESLLTGESVPVDKARGDEVSSGTLVGRGKGQLEVTRTGPGSAMGRLATMLGGIVAEPTPLEQRLAKLGRQLAVWVGGLALLLALGGLAAEGLGRFEEVVLFAVALAVAAVPEGMPAVVTLTLALGVQRMSKRSAVVRRLSAVEALGSVTVIATDKTGTLTENQMVVRALESPAREAALEAMVLASDADVAGDAGDPLELGLLAYARAAGLDPAALRARHVRVSSKPFDSAWRFMRVTTEHEGRRRSHLKGAPEVILPKTRLSEVERARWARRADEAAREGHRVLALAGGDGEVEEDLELLGLALLWDPPRAEVPGAIARAQRAGVRVLMITGDHPGTAQAVARAIGMADTAVITGPELDQIPPERLAEVVRRASVFARVSPEHKLRLVDALKASGEIVAMTGDGVNDAPALKRSDVGVAMGKRGSDVAREAADLVLLDDDFTSIVGAIEEGRSIYENIQSFIRFTFSTNVALVILIVTGTVGAWVMGLRDGAGALFIPLTALHLLWINFLGDGPPALALAVDTNPGVMDRPPRPAKSTLFDAASTRFIFGMGLFQGLLGVLLLGVLPRLGLAYAGVQTVLFLFQSLAKLASVYPARRVFHRAERNRVLYAAVSLGVGLQALAVLVPALRGLLGLTEVGAVELGALGLALLASVGFGEAAIVWLRRRRPAASPPEAPAKLAPA